MSPAPERASSIDRRREAATRGDAFGPRFAAVVGPPSGAQGRLKPVPTYALPAVAVELEAALQALDAPFDFGEVVRLAAAGAGRIFRVDVGGGSGLG